MKDCGKCKVEQRTTMTLERGRMGWWKWIYGYPLLILLCCSIFMLIYSTILHSVAGNENLHCTANYLFTQQSSELSGHYTDHHREKETMLKVESRKRIFLMGIYRDFYYSVLGPALLCVENNYPMLAQNCSLVIDYFNTRWKLIAAKKRERRRYFWWKGRKFSSIESN